MLLRTSTRNRLGYTDGGPAERLPRAERGWAAPPELGLTLIKAKADSAGRARPPWVKRRGVAKLSWRPALQTLFLAYLAGNFVLDHLRKGPEMDIENQRLQDGLD